MAFRESWQRLKTDQRPGNLDVHETVFFMDALGPHSSAYPLDRSTRSLVDAAAVANPEWSRPYRSRFEAPWLQHRC